MFEMGVYITDLSMHDVSRDLILVGTQQSNELTQALEQVSTVDCINSVMVCNSKLPNWPLFVYKWHFHGSAQYE